MIRVLQLDSTTTEWLRNMHTPRKTDVVGRYVEYDVASVAEVGWANAGCPLVATPLHTWVGSTSDVRHACSFCGEALGAGEPFTVHFNRTLTTPFVVACGMCGEKMR